MTAGWRSEARQRLNAATPGPWRTDGMHPEVDGPNGEHIISVMRQRREVWERGQDRDRYGHGTFPDIELIAHAPSDLRRALDALDAVLALHTPRRMSFDEGATWTDVCITCIEPLFGMHHEPWPCPTVKAIEGLE